MSHTCCAMMFRDSTSPDLRASSDRRENSLGVRSSFFPALGTVLEEVKFQITDFDHLGLSLRRAAQALRTRANSSEKANGLTR